MSPVILNLVVLRSVNLALAVKFYSCLGLEWVGAVIYRVWEKKAGDVAGAFCPLAGNRAAEFVF